jgi:WD40 repeat protein
LDFDTSSLVRPFPHHACNYTTTLMKVLISTGSALKTYDYAASSSSSNNTEPDELVLQSSVACVPSCVVMHPDGNKYLTVARATNQLVVWDKEGKRICVLKRVRPVLPTPRHGVLTTVEQSDADSKQPIVSPAFLERQSVVFASGSTSYIYQPSSSAAPTSYTGHPTGSIVTTLALNSDHTAFATGSNQGTLLVHNLTTHSQSTLHCKPKAPYTVLAYHPTRRTFLVAATSTGVIHLHDTTKPSAPLRSFTLDTSPLPSPINALAFSAVSSLLLACTSAGRLYFVDTATMKVLPTTIEVGAEVDQGGMQMEGKLVWFRGVKGVRLLDLKRREKGVRELNVCEGKDRVAGMAIQASLSTLLEVEMY